MRDDLTVLFNSLLEHHDNKLRLLMDFRNKEFELKNILNSRLDEGISELIDFENDIISEINIADYQIKLITDNIKRLSGIDPLKSGIDKYMKSEVLIERFRENLEYETELVKFISSLKSGNIKKMKEISSETVKFFTELERMENLNFIFPKDLQVF